MYNRRIGLLALLVTALALSSSVPSWAQTPGGSLTADVAIYGATPSGISAALAAARLGSTVVLIERTGHIGGLMANGLGATDIKNRGAIGGIFLEFVRAVKAHYVEIYGENSPQAQACNDGYYFEPHVAEMLFEKMVAAEPKITVIKMAQLDGLEKRKRRVESIRLLDRTGGPERVVSARTFVDATYEGDLAAMAGVPFRVGRESRQELGEPYAGVVYWDYRSKLYYPELSTGEGDDRIQAYNYRLCLTNVPDNRTTIDKPAEYDRFEYMIITRQVRQGKLKSFQDVVHIVPMPNGKSDTNNHTIPLLSTDLPEENYPYPTADWEWRDRFAGRLRSYTEGLLYFCQNDSSLPEEFRQGARQWGLAADEYEDNGNFPRQIYVREARRIEGEHDFIAQDCIRDIGMHRTPIQETSIACGSYEMDSHATRKYEPGIPVLEGLLGVFQYRDVYQVPYGVIVPKGVDGLLVCGAISGTHMGFSTLRMEPCWMAMGQAAGTASHLSLDSGREPRDVDIADLQRQLLADNAVIMYFDDVTWDSPVKEPAQFFGSRGFLETYTASTTNLVNRIEAADWLDRARRMGIWNRGYDRTGEWFVDVPNGHPSSARVRALAERGMFAEEMAEREFRPYEGLTPKALTRWFQNAGIDAELPDFTGRNALRRADLLGILYSMLPAED